MNLRFMCLRLIVVALRFSHPGLWGDAVSLSLEVDLSAPEGAVQFPCVIICRAEAITKTCPW